MDLTSIILMIATTTTALIAGLFYAYSCSVNPGLSKLPDQEYIAAMQSINKAIQNPLFFISFLGTFILLPVATYFSYHVNPTQRFFLLLAATLIYVIASFAVTIFGNVPLNNALDAFSLRNASLEEMANARRNFEGGWNSLHFIRTLASVVSLILVIIACLSRGASDRL